MPVNYPETGSDWCVQIEDASFWFQHRNEVLLAIMRRFPPATPLYDVGGGNGVVAAALARAGHRTIVVEPSATGAANARKRSLETLNATLETAPIPPGSAPAIGLFDVVEHIDDAPAFLALVRRALQRDARVYIAVPAYNWLWSGEDDFAQHIRRYTARSLAADLAAAGFEVEYSTYMFSFLLAPILLLRSLPWRLGWRRTPSLEGARSDHTAAGGASLLAPFRALEMTALRLFGRIPFGASVVVVARKSE